MKCVGWSVTLPLLHVLYRSLNVISWTPLSERCQVICVRASRLSVSGKSKSIHVLYNDTYDGSKVQPTHSPTLQSNIVLVPNLVVMWWDERDCCRLAVTTLFIICSNDCSQAIFVLCWKALQEHERCRNRWRHSCQDCGLQVWGRWPS